MRVFKALAFAACLALGAARAFAADSISFDESLSDKLRCARREAKVSCEELTTGAFVVKVNALSGLDPNDSAIAALLDPATPVSLSIGDWSWSGTLGDDPKYVAGKRKARIKLFHLGKCRDLGRGAVLCEGAVHGRIELSLTRMGISIRVTAKTGDPEVETPLGPRLFEVSPLAESLMPTVGPISTQIEAGIDIGHGAVSQSVVLPVTGSGQRKLVTKGGEHFDIDSIKLSTRLQLSGY